MRANRRSFGARRGPMRTGLARLAPGLVLAAAAAVTWLALSLLGGGTAAGARQSALPLPQPQLSDFMQMSKSETPPTQAQCASAGLRCFNPQSTRAAYNVNPLLAAGHDGRGRTIAVVDSYG